MCKSGCIMIFFLLKMKIGNMTIHGISPKHNYVIYFKIQHTDSLSFLQLLVRTVRYDLSILQSMLH